MGRRSLRSLLWRARPEDEIREEVSAHLEMLETELLERGLAPDEARRIAHERFGDPRRVEDECVGLARDRNRRWDLAQLVSEAALDLRTGLRQLRRRPASSLGVVALLTVGLAATALAATVLRDGLLSPPPYPDAESVHVLWETFPERGRDRNVVGPANFLVWRDVLGDRATLAGFFTTAVNLAADERPERVAARLVTDEYFSVLGVEPLVGRIFTAEEVAADADVIVLSESLWRARFGARRDVLGEEVPVNGRVQTVVGVMPSVAELDFGPEHAPYASRAELFVPLPVRESWSEQPGRWLHVLARRAPGVSAPDLEAALATAVTRAHELRPDFNAGASARLEGVAEPRRAPRRLPLVLLLGTTAFLLLMAGANASSLVVSRALERENEWAVRQAVGASGWRLARQQATEIVLLVGLATLAAAPLVLGGARVAHLRLPEVLSAVAPTETDLLAALGTLSIVAVGILLVGSFPAFLWIRRARLRSGTRLVGGGHRTRLVLVAVQVALASVLLFGAHLMTRSVADLLAVDAGYRVDDLVAFSVSNGGERPERAAFTHRFVAELETLPGVQAVGAMTHSPLVGQGAATSYHALDRPAPEAGDDPIADIRILAGDLLGTLGIELVEGRAFDSREVQPAEQGSVLVSESVARRLWPEGSALGQELQIAWGDGSGRRIVGVVRDVRLLALGVAPRDAIYFPQGQEPSPTLTYFLRTSRSLDALAAELREAVAEVDPEIPVAELRTFRRDLESSVADEVFLVEILVAFSLLALGLTALGVFGVVALGVTARTREIGMRRVLGARGVQVLVVCIRPIAGAVGLALAVGMAAATGLAAVFESLLFEVDPRDPGTLVATAAVLLGVAALASLVPARRATRIAPSEALRAD